MRTFSRWLHLFLTFPKLFEHSVKLFNAFKKNLLKCPYDQIVDIHVIHVQDYFLMKNKSKVFVALYAIFYTYYYYYNYNL